MKTGDMTEAQSCAYMDLEAEGFRYAGDACPGVEMGKWTREGYLKIVLDRYGRVNGKDAGDFIANL